MHFISAAKMEGVGVGVSVGVGVGVGVGGCRASHNNYH
jgi:hypothetical protein